MTRWSACRTLIKFSSASNWTGWLIKVSYRTNELNKVELKRSNWQCIGVGIIESSLYKLNLSMVSFILHFLSWRAVLTDLSHNTSSFGIKTCLAPIHVLSIYARISYNAVSYLIFISELQNVLKETVLRSALKIFGSCFDAAGEAEHPQCVLRSQYNMISYILLQGYVPYHLPLN